MNKEHLHPDGRPYTKEEFVEKIKTDKSFVKRFGNLRKIYGHQWRNWDGRIDQISELIKQLKENPDSRRLIVSAWNASDLPHQVLPPCHTGFQIYTRELSYKERYDIWFKNNYESGFEYNNTKSINFDDTYWVPTPKRAISLMFNMRSSDVPLGLPFNLASYGLLLEILAKTVNMVPGELIANLGDCHIYANQIEGIKEQLTRLPFELPSLEYMKTDEFFKSLSNDLSLLNCLDPTDFKIKNYQNHPTIKIPLSN